MKRLMVIALVAALPLAFALGALLGYKRHPMASYLVGLLEGVEDAVYATLLDEPGYLNWYFGRRIHDATWIDRVHPNILKTDPSALIRIQSKEKAVETRRRLREVVWPGSGFPAQRRPDDVIEGVEVAEFPDLPNLKRIDRLVVRMPHGATANALLFLAERHNGEFVIYHQGHEGHFALGKAVIRRFLQQGYGVVGMSMPMRPPNAGPVLNSPRFGQVAMDRHSYLAFLESTGFSPLSYFVEPVVAVTTYLMETHDQACTTLTGVSGGGWTTTLAAALDPRICRSYAVAGSLPPYVLSSPPNSGVISHYEEFHPGILAAANILEHYVLAAQGEGRAHKLIFNQYDRVNYRGIGATTFLEPVRSAVGRAGGGTFDVYIDATHTRHRISEHALDWIIADMRNSPRPLAPPPK